LLRRATKFIRQEGIGGSGLAVRHRGGCPSAASPVLTGRKSVFYAPRMPFDARRWPNAVTVGRLIAERIGMGEHCNGRATSPGPSTARAATWRRQRSLCAAGQIRRSLRAGSTVSEAAGSPTIHVSKPEAVAAPIAQAAKKCKSGNRGIQVRIAVS